MTTTIDLPDDLAEEVRRRAARDGQDLSAEVVALVRRGLVGVEHSAGGPIDRPVVEVDSLTGLPVIQSPPDAPIHRMTGDELQSLADRVLTEGDLERLGGLPVRR